MNKQTITKYAVAVVLGLGVVLGVSSLQAAWTTPAGAPPGNNVDAPINAGLSTQSKLGQLFVNTDPNTPFSVGLQVFGKTILNGGLQIASTSVAGKVLTADATGNATWVAPAIGSSVFDFALAGQSQTIAYAAAASTITVSNAGSARAAILNFSTPTCNDLNVEIYKTNDTKVARLGGHTGGGSDINDAGFTTIIPLSSGQFKIQDARAQFSCNDVKMVLIGLIN